MCISVCILLRSHFPLQVERLLHIVVATAQADEVGIAAGCHLLLVLLLQLKGTLQVLIRQGTDFTNIKHKATEFKQIL